MITGFFKVKFFCALAFLAAVFSCSKHPADDNGQLPPDKDYPSHTLIIYMMGADNGLAGFMDNNLGHILGSLDQVPENSRVALFYDRGNFTRLTELVLENGAAKQKPIKEYNVRESTAEPEFMSKVFDDIMENFSTETYGAVFSSHGGGWLPSDVFDEHIADAEITKRQGRRVVTRFFGQDKYECMELPEMASAIEKYGLSYIVFDACFMASVEGLYDLRECADYVVASSAEVLGSGFPYKTIFRDFFRGKEGLESICRKFMAYYREGNADWKSATISLIDMNAMDGLASSTKEVLGKGFTEPSADNIQAFEGMPVHCYFDFGQYIETGGADKDALEKFRKSLKQTVLFADHTETIYSDYGARTEMPVTVSCGLTCHIAQKERPRTEEAYRNTEWAKRVRP